MVILDFIKALKPHFFKNDIGDLVRTTKFSLDNSMTELVRQANEHFKVNKSISQKNKDLTNVFYRNYDLGSSNSKVNVFAELYTVLPKVSQNLSTLDKEFDEIQSKDIITAGLTIRKANVIRSIQDIVFINNFLNDFMTVYYNNESLEVAKKLGSEEANKEFSIEISDRLIKRVEMGIAYFAQLLSIYGSDNKSFVKKIEKLPDVVLNEKTAGAVMAVYKNTDLDIASVNAGNFYKLNPFFFIANMYAMISSDYYKSLNDKKTLLELRLMHLQMLAERKEDPKLEQEIFYIQNRIEKIEYKISKMENN